ncbi:MAG TPA: lyase family protein [Acidobacteriota bacterium]|nr:lyase family protein [Acidobacteriota bacterium]
MNVYQPGAGTSHNMNVNEVVANRAIELLGGRKGDYTIVHPADRVNMAQSTNDLCPTAIRISAITETRFLLESLAVQSRVARRLLALTVGSLFPGNVEIQLRRAHNLFERARVGVLDQATASRRSDQ